VTAEGGLEQTDYIIPRVESVETSGKELGIADAPRISVSRTVKLWNDANAQLSSFGHNQIDVVLAVALRGRPSTIPQQWVL